MTTTVIDALVVELGLDPSNFEKGRKKAASEMLKAREQAIGDAKAVEEAAKKSSAGIERMARNLIGLFAALAGARSLKDLVVGLNDANAELGRFSANMGESPQKLAAWGMAAARYGGDAKATAATIQSMSKALYDLHNNAQPLPNAFYRLQNATDGFVRTDQGALVALEDTLKLLAKLSKTDPSQAFNIAQELNYDPGTLALARAQGDAIGAFVDEIERSFTPTNNAIKVAQDLQAAWAKLTDRIGVMVNRLVELGGETLSRLLNRLDEWITLNEKWIKTGITDAVERFAAALEGIDWNDVSNGFAKFASTAEGVAGSFMSIVKALGTMSTWITGGVVEDNPADPDWQRKTLERLGGEGAADLLMERPLYRGSGDGIDPTTTESINPDTRVDGRPVSRGNPMPVTIQQGGPGGGRGFFDTLMSWWTGDVPNPNETPTGGGVVDTVKKMLFGGGEGAADTEKAAASVPNIEGMTADERNKLGLILKYESRGRNVMNYEGIQRGLDPNTARGFTAQGYYQILNSNWRRLAGKLGIKTTNAMSSSLEDQTKVALALMRESGIGNWRNFNPKLKSALDRGENAGSWAERVPEPQPAGGGVARWDRPNEARAWPGQDTGGLGAMLGANLSAAMSSISNDNSRSVSSNVDTRIQNLIVNAKDGNPDAIARHMWEAIDKRSGAYISNQGPM